ncbi:MAG: MBL fold metallo-hydrolase [Ectothiorhodospiraceae bacterium]|nr:MBL fold metallo-hydrolase [Ectothiorhodospiraceae bacterium]
MNLPEVDRIRITSVVDNFVDLLLRDEGPARRRPRRERVFEGCLCAEHGLAELVESSRGTEVLPLMFDFGASPLVFLHNLDLLVQDYGVDLGAIRTMVLSHGHWDHFGGLLAFLRQHRESLPEQAHLYAGEDAFLARWQAAPRQPRRDMGMLDQAAIEALGVGIVKVREPQLLSGQALLSGEIARRTSYEVIPSTMRVDRDGEDIHDELPGEQSIVYHLRGKGLVVLTACGHAGVVNTVMHAREVTGVEEVHAIIGGFHLSGAPQDRIQSTVDDLIGFDPDIIVPMHCTGIETIDALRERAPEKVIFNSAGTRYELTAG